MRVITHPEPGQLQLTAALHALSDPVRLQIVWALADGQEMPCGCIEVGISKSTLTHHLKVLRDAGLTHTRNVGVQRLVSLRRDDVEERFPGLLDLVFANAPDAQGAGANVSNLAVLDSAVFPGPGPRTLSQL